ncbi:DUF255 domain-containing protein [Allorhodopirellula heiligendammensis]|uniref:Thiol:disulfide interchange protein n=1 Tax=Allorhodopirellula heiligendammensis TaxID=2714739 RepID=A0A5C6C180_9BACT|nr:DUF255 domain-containing protein [Allorhodopirellula heiligendammensis]TWU18333.1 thiol:disulfide interchange protein precursor [Allorhodopirellula heiligendammensis]
MRLAWLTQLKSLHIVRAGVLIAGSSVCFQPLSAEIPWRDQLTAAHAEAKAQNKPLLLHFYTDNCVWCDKLEAGAFQSPEVEAAVANGFVPVKIHASESRDLAKMFKVTKFPMDVVVTPEGETLAHTVSPQEPAKYIAMLTQASSKMPAPAAFSPEMYPNNSNTPAAGMQIAGAEHLDVELPNLPKSDIDSRPVDEVAATPAMQSTSESSVGKPAAEMPGGGIASLASARMKTETPATADPQTALDAELDASPKLAMEGFCAVTVIDEDQWIEGNPKFGVVHLGKLYLFSSTEKMDVFLADPMRYTPVLNEIDVVRFFEERRIVPGQRRFGMRDPIHQRMFFFADEASMNHFHDEFERYTDAAIEVMNQAVADANPDTL